MDKKFTRSSTDKILGGVCGGVAAYTGTDVSLIRLLTALAVLFTGVGPIVYIIAWLVMPADDGKVYAQELFNQADQAVKDYRTTKTQQPPVNPNPTDPYGNSTGMPNSDDLR